MHVSIRISRNEFRSSVIEYIMKLKRSQICVILYSSYIEVLVSEEIRGIINKEECYNIIARNITVIFKNNNCYLLG